MSASAQSQKVAQLHRHAALCGVFAANAVSPSDRDLLLRMQGAWLERARHQDFIDGQPPRPPAGSNVLAVPRG